MATGKAFGSIAAGALLFVALMGLCVSCHGKSRLGSPSAGKSPETESASAAGRIDELRSSLQSEFARLGIDPERKPASAPTGNDNAVFDLSASIIDPDGPAGPLPPEGVSLSWTERMLGDYDQNGEVGISDITPIALNWLASVTYRLPIEAAGYDYWPIGDPDGAEAANWRKARIDGNADGEVGMQDVTPIALHWMERLDGWRIYRKGPGEVSYSLVPNPDDLASPVTIPRSSVPGNALPVRYAFEDGSVTDGIVSFYVASYDEATNQDGPASPAVSVNPATGEINQSPIARLKITPDYGAAPFDVTFDASLSNDPDGTIAEHRFDFDGDGLQDYSTLDPEPPAESSAGLVEDIAIGASPGIVTGKCRTGNENYFYPKVTVVDDKAEESSIRNRLGVAGWLGDAFYSWTGSGAPFGPMSLSLDPSSGETVGAGPVWNNNYPPLERGAWLVWRHGFGVWEFEKVIGENDPQWSYAEGKDYGRAQKVAVFWDENCKPLVLIEAKSLGVSRLLSARKDGLGQWELKLVFEGYSEPPTTPRGSKYNWHIEYGPGHFTILAADQYSGDGETANYKYYFLTYDNGNWTVLDANWDTKEQDARLGDLSVFPDGGIGAPLDLGHSQNGDQMQVWIAVSNGSGEWTRERWDSGQFEGFDSIRYFKLIFGPDQTAWVPIQTWDGIMDGYGLQLLSVGSTGSNTYDLTNPDYPVQSVMLYPMNVNETPSLMYRDDNSPSQTTEPKSWNVRICTFESDWFHIETIYAPKSADWDSNGVVSDYCAFGPNNSYVLISETGGDAGNGNRRLRLLYRVDPAQGS
ncbi:MAG: hypothetical protein HRF49_11395 [bacterium]|jgi:hypothetical protein